MSIVGVEPLFNETMQVFRLFSGKLFHYADCYDEDDGEDTADQKTEAKVVAGTLRDNADETGTDRAAEITRHGEQCEHRRTAEGDGFGGDADCSGPHDRHRKAADNAADESEHRVSGERG